MSGGLGRLFSRIIPLITLVCCLCYGIIHIFDKDNNHNLTYLTASYYNTETYEKIENPNEEEKQNAELVYEFDMVAYTQNIDIDIIKRSIQRVIDLQAYQKTVEKFETIWNDGYQVGDISKTLLNSISMILNTTILIINAVLYPIRVIAGILLTSMSLIGININNGIVIIPFLKFVLDKLAIPYVNSIAPQAEYYPDLYQTRWQWDINALENYFNSFTNQKKEYNLTFTINFASLDTGTRMTKFTYINVNYNWNNKHQIQITYWNIQGTTKEDIVVYKNGWIYDNAQIIEILKNDLDTNENYEMTLKLDQYFNQIT